MKITSTNICGSDLQIYEGRAPLEPGTAIGHENTGEVVEVGDAVVRVKVGAMVSRQTAWTKLVEHTCRRNVLQIAHGKRWN